MTNKHCASDVKFPKWVDDIEESVKSKAFTKDFVVMKWHLGLLGKKIVVWAWLTSPLQNQGKIFQSKTCFQKCLQQKIFYFCKVQLPMLISKVTSKEIKKDVQVIIEHILCLSCNLYSRDFFSKFQKHNFRFHLYGKLLTKFSMNWKSFLFGHSFANLKYEIYGHFGHWLFWPFLIMVATRICRLQKKW